MGLHQPSDVRHFDAACVSVNRLRGRKNVDLPFRDWIMDSGAFSELSQHGRYRHGVEEYAEEALRWTGTGNLQAVVAQDYMCEPWILAKTGLTVAEHQRLTIERYQHLRAARLPVHVMPVLQGFKPVEYLNHVTAYGGLLKRGNWTGVGSVCKRNSKPEQVIDVLRAIKSARPDLRLHGFGLKRTALERREVRELLHSADSMAWSFAARYEGRNANDWREAQRYVFKIRELDTCSLS